MLSKKSRLFKTYVLIAGLFALTLTVSLVIFNLNDRTESGAVSASDWKAGNIINDTVFYNNNSMSTSDIQNFLNQKNPTCDTWGTQPASEYGRPDISRAQYAQSVGWEGPPYICLKDYHQVPRSDTVINNYNSSASIPGGAMSAAQIIKTSADTYGVNPKVLLVLLQKESAGPLPVDKWPLQRQYRAAMGYACPDTAPCDPQFVGFYNQMMNAARQIKIYKDNPNSYRHKPFATASVYFNPDLARCGNTSVYLETRATAGLYNYTPYQPNAAALNNMYGSGDNCSAYGNRNFWRIFSDWFGSTEREQTLISFKSQMNGKGWSDTSINSGITGTIGENRPLEAIRIDGNVEYSSYNVTAGWQPTASDGMVSGTEGQAKSIQAIRINPIGSLSNSYDIYYRTHVSNIGWLGWTKNGAVSGTIGGNHSIEAVEIYLANKGASAPGSTSDSVRTISTATQPPAVSITTQSHVSDYGWQSAVPDGMISGMTNRGRGIEALRMKVSGISGDISYSAHVSGNGWQGYAKNEQVSGTQGQSKAIEAIRIAGSGELYKQYDIWYRAYVEGMGWLDWTSNNNPAGSVGASKKLEAVELRLVTKGANGPGNKTGGVYNPQRLTMPDSSTLTYSGHVSGVGWTSVVNQPEVAGTAGQTKSLEAFRINSAGSAFGPIAVKCDYVSAGIGWTAAVNNVCGTEGQSRPLRAVRLSLTDELKAKYTISYRVHLGWMGWQNWQSEGTIAGFPDDGTTSHPIEAISIRITEK